MSVVRLPTIGKQLYRLFIEPRQINRSLRNRELVFNVVLAGTGLCMTALTMLLLQSFLSGNSQVAVRLGIASLTVAFVGALHWLSRTFNYYFAGYLLVGLYSLLAAGSMAAWGIGTPIGLLLGATVIVMAGAILGSRYTLYIAGLMSLLAITVQQAGERGHFLTSTASKLPTGVLGDAIGDTILFASLGSVSWLFGREMERSLARAEAAEAALEQDNASLEVRVKVRTAELKKAQLEEMRHLYQFAEVGQLSTSLLHDLANYLSVLSLDINSLNNKQQAETLARCREAIRGLTSLLGEVRGRIAKGPTKQRYNLVEVIGGTVSAPQYKNSKQHAYIDWQPPKRRHDFNLHGDPIKFAQIISILLGNAFDAYEALDTSTDNNRIEVRAQKYEGSIRITVADWGSGVSRAHRKKIFMPEFSTKKKGMGIGLYLARQMVATELAGTLTLAPNTKKTEFVLRIPETRHDS